MKTDQANIPTIDEVNAEIQLAETRIRPYTLTTPLLHSRALSAMTGANVYLKLENEQHTGSFKARGSLNKILSLTPEQKLKGAVTASTGNHGLGFSRACEIAEIDGIVFLPKNASKTKVEALKHYPATLKFHSNNSLETEIFAREYARKEGLVWVSPYNDLQILSGQGTIGLELVSQLDKIDACFITIGGGGLISGIASYLSKASPNTEIIGCQPLNSHEMYLSKQAGKIVPMPESLDTLSDGSAGGIEDDAITFPLCQQLVHEYILAKEEEIANALKIVVHAHHKVIEGAAAVTVASLIKSKERFSNKNVVLVICGANISIDKLRTII